MADMLRSLIKLRVDTSMNQADRLVIDAKIESAEEKKLYFEERLEDLYEKAEKWQSMLQKLQQTLETCKHDELRKDIKINLSNFEEELVDLQSQIETCKKSIGELEVELEDLYRQSSENFEEFLKLYS